MLKIFYPWLLCLIILLSLGITTLKNSSTLFTSLEKEFNRGEKKNGDFQDT